MDLAAIGTTIKDVGFPVAVAVVAIFVLVKLGTWVYERAEARLDAKTKECAEERARFEARLDAKEAAHAAEREKHSQAYLTAINALTLQVQQTAQSLNALGGTVAEIRGSLRRASGE
jgi:hypothetical protein